MFEQNISLRQYSNYKIGGKAKFFYRAKGLADLVEAVTVSRAKELPVFILGGGTNLLINDEGFDGLVLKPDICFIYQSEIYVHVGVGILVSDLLNFCAKKGLSGLEWAGGLPGTLGGAIRGNAGAFGGEIKDLITEVVSLDIHQEQSKIIKRNNQNCQFGYRNSIFKKLSSSHCEKRSDETISVVSAVESSLAEIIISATFSLKFADPKIVRQAIDEKINYRLQRHPMEYPNVGSIFKNVDWHTVPVVHQENFKAKMKNDPFPILPTAVLIDRCGLRGVSCGGAMISPKHPNFIVNTLDATATDVKNLIKLVKETVLDRFGIKLEEEVQEV